MLVGLTRSSHYLAGIIEVLQASDLFGPQNVPEPMITIETLCDACKRATVGPHFACVDRIKRWKVGGTTLREAQKIVSGESRQCSVCHPSLCETRAIDPTLTGVAAEANKGENAVPLSMTETSNKTNQELSVKQQNNPYYCQWNVNNSLAVCEARLLAVYPQLLQAKKFYFLGDSTMARMHTHLLETKVWREVKRRQGPEKSRYYDFQHLARSLEQHVTANNTLGEGPYPVDRLGKTSCVTCTNRLLRYSDKSITNKTFDSEFLAMEYALDRTFQTKNTTTSQETMSLYMKQWNAQFPPNETVCIANTGMHEMRIVPFKSGDLYAQHVLQFQQMMKERHCSTFIWVSINQVKRNDDVFPQTKRRVSEFNSAVQHHMLRQRDSPNFYLDVFPKSAAANHSDHTHMCGPDYYQPLSRFFFRIMTGTSDVTSLL
jgi:hypothetical protein